MVKNIKALLQQASKYIAKGLERGAYTETVGQDRAATRLLAQIRDYVAKTRPRAADAEPLLARAAQYISKGLAEDAYTETAGGNLFAERLLEKMRTAFGAPSRESRQRATKKKSSAQLEREIVKTLEAGGKPQFTEMFAPSKRPGTQHVPQTGRRFRVDLENQPERFFGSAEEALRHGMHHVHLPQSRVSEMLRRLANGEPAAWSHEFTSVDIDPC